MCSKVLIVYIFQVRKDFRSQEAYFSGEMPHIIESVLSQTRFHDWSLSVRQLRASNYCKNPLISSSRTKRRLLVNVSSNPGIDNTANTEKGVQMRLILQADIQAQFKTLQNNSKINT